MKLIVNADDFGLSYGVTDGIYDAINRGIVTSTTMMVTMQASEYAATLIKRDESLAVGLHINITLGKPLTDCKSLLSDGSFVKPKTKDIHDSFNVEDLDKEIQAQYDRFVFLTGKQPTHLDSHLYAHQIYDNVKQATLRLANKYGIPVREYTTNKYDAVAYDGRFKVLQGEREEEMQNKLLTILASHNEEKLEILCHPAFVDDFLLNNSSYNLQRTLEHKVLTSNLSRDYIASHSIELVNYKNIR